MNFISPYVYFETTTKTVDALQEDGLQPSTIQWGRRVISLNSRSTADEKARELARENNSDPLVLQIPLGILVESQRLANLDAFLNSYPIHVLSPTDLDNYNRGLKSSYPRPKPKDVLSKLLLRQSSVYASQWEKSFRLMGAVAYADDINWQCFENFEYIKICLVEDENYND